MVGIRACDARWRTLYDGDGKWINLSDRGPSPVFPLWSCRSNWQLACSCADPVFCLFLSVSPSRCVPSRGWVLAEYSFVPSVSFRVVGG